MNEDFEKSIFTFYFKSMTYLGSFVIETNNPVKRFFYILYANLVNVMVWFILYMGLLDFIESMPDFDRLSYNICINLLIIGTWGKTMQIIHKSRRINSLKRRVHRDLKTCKDPEELKIYNDAIKDLHFITNIFYFFLVWLYPFWLVLSLYNTLKGRVSIPLPAKWPFSVDKSNTSAHISIITFHGAFALFYLGQAISIDTSMFGLLIQIYREYRFLIKRINEFSEYCDNLFWQTSGTKNGNPSQPTEINIYLKKAKVKEMLRGIIIRQKEIFRFTEDFEYSYNMSMFIQIFAGGLLLCVNAIQAMIVSSDFSIKMGYQLGYVAIILINILYLCWLSNRVSLKCREVGTACYNTPWYKFNADIQRDICLVILRSQKPPKITSGNFIQLNLVTFMEMMKNIYSWLALFRQVALK